METYLGAIELFSFAYGPQGWLLCNGQILNVQQYQALYALIGQTYYGGNGTTTFALPNLQGFEPIPGMQYYIATTGCFPPRG